MLVLLKIDSVRFLEELQIDTELLVAAVKAADAPVICETADEGRKDDIAFLREKTSG